MDFLNAMSTVSWPHVRSIGCADLLRVRRNLDQDDAPPPLIVVIFTHIGCGLRLVS